MQRILNFLLLTALAHSYTVNDITQSCLPCVNGMLLAHPTNCMKYYSCTSRTWSLLDCPASTYYSQSDSACIDGRNIDQPTCPYDRGINENKDKPFSSLSACAHITSTRLPDTSEPTTSPTTSTEGGDGARDRIPLTTDSPMTPDRLTVILGALLGTLVFLVLLAIVIVVLIRWRKRKNRPRNFYSSIPGRGPSSKLNEQKTRGGANNDVYLAKSLIKKRQQTQEDIYQEVDSGISDADDAENKPYYSLPPNRRRPRQPANPSHSTLPPTPLQIAAASDNHTAPNQEGSTPQYDGAIPQYSGTTPGTYARTESQLMDESATYQPIDERDIPADDDPTYQPISEDPTLESPTPNYNTGVYTHPSDQSTGSHQYATALSPSAQYDYCKPDVDMVVMPDDLPPAPGRPAPLPPLPPAPESPQEAPVPSPRPPTAPKPLPRGQTTLDTGAQDDGERVKSGDSIPYYVQPMADDDSTIDLESGYPQHNYHTLEPPLKRN